MFLGCWEDDSSVKGSCPSNRILVWILTSLVKWGQHLSVHVLNFKAGGKGIPPLMASLPISRQTSKFNEKPHLKMQSEEIENDTWCQPPQIPDHKCVCTHTCVCTSIHTYLRRGMHLFTKCIDNFGLHLRCVMVIEGIPVESIHISIEKTFSGSMLLFLNTSDRNHRLLPLPSLTCLEVLHIALTGNVLSYSTYREVDWGTRKLSAFLKIMQSLTRNSHTSLCSVTFCCRDKNLWPQATCLCKHTPMIHPW